LRSGQSTDTRAASTAGPEGDSQDASAGTDSVDSRAQGEPAHR